MNASSRLADLLARTLSGAMPTGYSVRAVAGQLDVYRGNQHIADVAATKLVDDDDDRSSIDRATTAVRAALDALQDIISEELRLPWPPASPGSFARADVDSEGGEIHLGFTDDSGDVLRLPAFPWPSEPG